MPADDDHLPDRVRAAALRCSDADREQVAEVLRRATGDGRLTLDELDDRLERTYAARTYADLVPVVADLPGALAPQPDVPTMNPFGRPSVPGSLARVGGEPTNTWAAAFWGSSSRGGLWVVPETFTAVAIMGVVELDLREAWFAAPVVEVRAWSIMGGVVIVVPDDVVVDCQGLGIMGSFDGPHEPAQPGVVVVRVTGVALMGSVEVKRKKRKSKRLPSG